MDPFGKGWGQVTEDRDNPIPGLRLDREVGGVGVHGLQGDSPLLGQGPGLGQADLGTIHGGHRVPQAGQEDGVAALALHQAQDLAPR